MKETIPNLTVWRNALSGAKADVSSVVQDLEVYESVIDSAVDKFLQGEVEQSHKKLFQSVLESVDNARAAVHKNLREGRLSRGKQWSDFQRVVERLHRVAESDSAEDVLLDELLSGSVTEGRLRNNNTFVVDVYLEGGDWWERRHNRGDAKVPDDIAGTLSRFSDDDIAKAYVFFTENPATGGFRFEFAAVDGNRVPRLLGNNFWKHWAEDIRDAHKNR